MKPCKSQIIPFDFDGTNVRTITDETGAPWFNGKDVCDALGYIDSTNAMKQHCRGVVKRHPIVDALNRKQMATFIQERDLYRLIMRSRLPAAEAFEEWVVGTVLPSIRKTGQYQADWKTKRHAAASSSKVMTGMLEFVRGTIGKPTQAHHYMNEHKLINSNITGEFKGIDRDSLTPAQLDMLASLEIRDTVFMGMGMDYEQRKAALAHESVRLKSMKLTESRNSPRH
jgi:prophage antirepressor-like protein